MSILYMTFMCATNQPMPARMLETAESIPTWFVAVHVYTPAPSTMLLSLEGPVVIVIAVKFTYIVSSSPSLDQDKLAGGSPTKASGQVMVNDWPSRR